MSHSEWLAMARYLVACTCGRQHTVETRQAGETIVCECGATVAVPTLRQLRQLPEAGADTTGAAGSAAAAGRGPSAGWGARQRLITVCLLVAAVALAVVGGSRMLEKPVPKLDKVEYTKGVERVVANLTPVQAWEIWQKQYEPLRSKGFEVYRAQGEAAMKQALSMHRGTQMIGLAVAAVCAVAAIAVWLAKGGK
jgi:hypothetical protein